MLATELLQDRKNVRVDLSGNVLGNNTKYTGLDVIGAESDDDIDVCDIVFKSIELSSTDQTAKQDEEAMEILPLRAIC